MMAEPGPRPWSVEDFLAFEAEEVDRYELLDGIVRMMTGGSAAHSRIKTNVTNALNDPLREGLCSAYVDDLKVVTETTVMYPDVLVVCKPLSPDEDRVLEPAVVVERGTLADHRDPRSGAQVAAVQTIAPLKHLVLVGQSERRIEVYTRERDGWQRAVVEPPADAVALKEVGASLSLEEIYQDSGR
jgi:Uma2 family endonuclease